MKRPPSFLPQLSPHRTRLYSTPASKQSSRLPFTASNLCEFESRLHPANRPVTYPSSSFVGGFFFNPIFFPLLHFSNIAHTACRAFRPSAEEVIPRSPVFPCCRFYECCESLHFESALSYGVWVYSGGVCGFEGMEIWWSESHGRRLLGIGCQMRRGKERIGWMDECPVYVYDLA